MIGFELEVNIMKQPRQSSAPYDFNASFNDTEYIRAKDKAEKYIKIFAEEGDTVHRFVSYDIYTSEGLRKAGTIMLVDSF